MEHASAEKLNFSRKNLKFSIWQSKQGVHMAVSVCFVRMQMFRSVLEIDILIAHTTKGKEILTLS